MDTTGATLRIRKVVINMTDYLKCSKCGSEKFLIPYPAANLSMACQYDKDRREYTCKECGHMAVVKKIRPTFQKVILSPDEKVVE